MCYNRYCQEGLNPTQLHKEDTSMFKRKSILFSVTFKFIDSDETYTDTATSAGLASLMADPTVEIISTTKL
jgi:hypothetical protein